MNRLLKRWRRRATPYTVRQIRRHQRIRLATAIVLFACVGAATVFAFVAASYAPYNGAVDFALLLAMLSLLVYLGRVVRRRWRRYREQSKWLKATPAKRRR